MVHSPSLHPLLNPPYIPIDVIRLIASQFNHNVLIIPLSCFLEKHLHDLRIQILLQLLLGVLASAQAVVQGGGIGAQVNDEIYPADGEEVAGMPVDDVTSLLRDEGFEVVEELEAFRQREKL